MPTIPVAGTPRLANTTMIQPPPSQVIETDTTAIPEPAIAVADIPRPSQDELAALSIATQNVNKRNTMTPAPVSDTPEYKFTDADRKKASVSRWSSKYPWEVAALDDALAYLAEIRAECERGGLILQKRVSELKVEKVKCFGCDNIINLSEGRWATMRTRNNFETNIPESAYACSAACGLKLNREFTHPVAIRQPLES